MKYVIVGGGISGLYTALILVDIHKINPSEIIVVEKSHRWGRRVHTLEKDGIKYECAASRFTKNHKLLFELIQRYNLTDKLIQLSNKTISKSLNLPIDSGTLIITLFLSLFLTWNSFNVEGKLSIKSSRP